MGNVTGVQKTPTAQRIVGLTLGAIVLGLLVVLAVVLPKAQGDTGSADLPETLPGGWTAADALDPDDVPEAAGADAEELVERQVDQRKYVEDTYAEVYDEAPAFRVYTDEELRQVALVTVFETGPGSFAPPQGLVDPEVAGLERAPVELVREGDALCAVSYQAVAAGEDSGEPQTITCQQPSGSRTVQLTTQGVSVDDTFTLLDEISTELA